MSAPEAKKKEGAPKFKTNPVEDFLLGGTAAAISKTVAAPIERVKLLLQNQGDASAIAKKYTGIVDVFVRVPQEQGFASFWRGNVSNVLRYFPTQALNFAFKDYYKQYLEYPRSAGFLLCLLGNMASGGAAGVTSLAFVYPLDFARTRLAMDTGKGAAREFNGTFDVILKTAQTSGWGKGGVYNGFVVSAVGIVIYRGAYFGLYDTVAPLVASVGSAGFLMKFTLAYAITVAAGLISYPLDTVRRRMMMTSGKHAGKYTSSIDCFTKVLAQEGVPALFKGASANILRGLAGSLVLVGFDYCKSFYLEWKYPELRGQKKELKVVMG